MPDVRPRALMLPARPALGYPDVVVPVGGLETFRPSPAGKSAAGAA